MGKAVKTGLPRWVNKFGKEVYAHKISEIVPFKHPMDQEAKTLWFRELDKKVNMIGIWCEKFQPKVGGYWVAEDGNNGYTECFYLPKEIFEQEYK